MAKLALSGCPQVHTRRVAKERWSLSGSTLDIPVLDVVRFAAQIHNVGAIWLESSAGVEAITSPGGETVLPIWSAGHAPRGWSSDVGRFAPVELTSLLDHVLPEVDQHDDLVGVGIGDVVQLVHPALLRRRLLLEPDPLP